MKKLLFIACALAFSNWAKAQTPTYTPVTLTGFNADIVANGSGTVASSTSQDADGATFALVAQNYVSPTNASPTSALPNNGTINSAATTGVTFQLASFTGNNALQISAPGSGTLNFASPRGADQLYLLMTSGSGISTVTATVNFTDATTQVFPAISVSDWYNGTGFAIQGISRVSRATNAIENTSTNPRLYQTLLTLTPANAAKTIQSVTFNKTSTTGVLNVMGVTARFVTPPMPNDLGVSAIAGISSGCGLSSQETITVTINSSGTASQSNFPVSYQINNQTPVTETFTGTVAAFGTATYTFTTKANLSAVGAYTISAKTLLPTDGNATNDASSVSVTNSLLPSLPISLDFETSTSGLSVFKTAVNSNSAVAEGTGASSGTGTKGLIMDGVSSSNWIIPTGVTDPWTSNLSNLATAKICINPTAGGSASDPLWLSFDLKQLYKTANANTNFRITVNGTQVGTTYRPPFSGTPIVWQRINIDLSSYKSLPNIEIGFESNVKEAYANGTGTANLIDNIKVTRSSPTGLKENELANQLSIFPNPSTGTFNITFPTSGFLLEVTDLTGKVIMQQVSEGKNTQLKLNNAASGIYLLKATKEGQTAFRKLVVE